MLPVQNIVSTNNNKRKLQGLSREVVRFGVATPPSAGEASSTLPPTVPTGRTSGRVNPFSTKRQKLNPKQQELARLEGEATRIQVLTGLHPRDRQEIQASAPDAHDAEEESYWYDIPVGLTAPADDSDDDVGNVTRLNDPAQVYGVVSDAMHGPTYTARVHRKRRTRTERIHREAYAWEIQIDSLADALLLWRASSTASNPDLRTPEARSTNLPPFDEDHPPPGEHQPPATSLHNLSLNPQEPLSVNPLAPMLTRVDTPPSTPPPVLGCPNPDIPTLRHSESPPANSHPPSYSPTQPTSATSQPQAAQPQPSPPVGDTPAALGEERALFFEVDALGWHWRDSTHRIPYAAEEAPNVALIRHGLLSSSPLLPSLAISIQTLESYRILRLHSPRLSILSFAKALCATYGQPYRPSLRQHLSDVYDGYLLILRHIDSRVDKALGFDTPDWRLRHSCPPCQYVLEDEPPLAHPLLISLDGGMSLKRFADAGNADQRSFKSDYFLPREDVDAFKDEVKTRKKPAKGKGESASTVKGKGKKDTVTEAAPTDGGPSAESADKGKGKEKAKGKGKAKEKPGSQAVGAEETGHEGCDEADATGDLDAADVGLELDAGKSEEYYVKGSIPDPLSELNDVLSVCVERWKANAPDHKKGMFECFEESGLFISICRHGNILVVCDMVRSGELSKYPLAILKKLQEVFPDMKMVGYDIGCAFEETSAKTSLGKTLRAHFIVPAMHGYAHNRPCQLKHHPKYTVGAGLEDFEGCERVFSSSNDCARTTRHATAYHRHQAIHEHFRQWDRDKYAALGLFLRNNYRQALSNVEAANELFANPHHADHVLKGDYLRWLDEEGVYLNSLKHEPEEETLGIAYVEALQALAKAEATFETERPVIPNPNTQVPPTPSDTGRQKRPIKKTFKAAMEQVSFCQTVVADLESQLQVHERWTPLSPEYQASETYLVRRKYHTALATLELRIVSRLFELQKAHIQDTGYKVRTQIMKHLKTRSESIRTAITAYNTAASRLKPPRPKIKFEDVLDLSFLAEFDLLRDARQDVRSKPWANPAMRSVIDRYCTLLRSQEEIIRLNIEMRRLRTWVRDVEAHYDHVIRSLSGTNTSLARELQSRALHQHRVHSHILARLDEVERFKGFSGTSGCGKRKGGSTMGVGNAGEPQRSLSLEVDSDSESDSEQVEVTLDGLHNALVGMET